MPMMQKKKEKNSLQSKQFYRDVDVSVGNGNWPFRLFLSFSVHEEFA